MTVVPSLSLATEPHQEMQMSPKQWISLELEQRIQQHTNNSKICGDIVAYTFQQIMHVCLRGDDAYRKVITPQNIQGITAKIARCVVLRMWSQEMPLDTIPSQSDDKERLVKDIQDLVEEQFMEWWEMWKRDQYVSSAEIPAERDFLNAFGPVDWETVISSNEWIKGIDPDNVGKLDRHTQVTEAVANTEVILGINPMKRYAFDTVRKAEYKKMHTFDVGELLPKIEQSYNRAWLSPDILQDLADGRIDDFIRRTRKGVFVEGFHEKIRGASIGGTMRANLQRTFEYDEPSYEGRYLQDDQGKILAWLTFWKLPQERSQKTGDFIRKYLRRGMSGRMLYTPQPTRKELEDYAEETILIDTIKGGEVPFAASRLMCHVTEEIYQHSPYTAKFMGCWLHDIQLDPPLAGRHPYSHLSHNRSSSNFFQDRDCKTVAYDASKRSPLFRRTLPRGSGQISFRQIFAAFSGWFDEVRQRSAQKWHETQSIYGDVTHDKYQEPR